MRKRAETSETWSCCDDIAVASIAVASVAVVAVVTRGSVTVGTIIIIIEGYSYSSFIVFLYIAHQFFSSWSKITTIHTTYFCHTYTTSGSKARKLLHVSMPASKLSTYSMPWFTKKVKKNVFTKENTPQIDAAKLFSVGFKRRRVV